MGAVLAHLQTIPTRIPTTPGIASSTGPTDLEWDKSDNGAQVNYEDARRLATACRVGGRVDWRLPTIDEVRTLYAPQNRSETPSGRVYHIARSIMLRSTWVWAESSNFEPDPMVFSFETGTSIVLREPWPFASVLLVRGMRH